MARIENVAGGNPVTASWGNAVRDASVMQVTTAERSSITAVTGQMCFDTTLNRYFVYSGTAWVPTGLAAVPAGRVGCTVLRNANQSIPTGVGRQGVTFDAENYDSDGFFTASSTDIVIPTGLGGLYGVSFTIWWATSPGTSSYTRLAIIPTSGNYGNIDGDSSTGSTSTLGGTPHVTGNAGFWAFNDGDKVQLFCSQQTGSAINITARVQLFRIGV